MSADQQMPESYSGSELASFSPVTGSSTESPNLANQNDVMELKKYKIMLVKITEK